MTVASAIASVKETVRRTAKDCAEFNHWFGWS